MKTILSLGFLLLVAFGCTKPLDPGQESSAAVGPPEQEASTAVEDHAPLSPAQARAALQERGIPYSQRSFLGAAGQGDLEVVRLFVEAGMNIAAQTWEEGYDTALMRTAGGGHLAVVAQAVKHQPGKIRPSSHPM